MDTNILFILNLTQTEQGLFHIKKLVYNFSLHSMGKITKLSDRWHLLLRCHVGHQVTDTVAVAKLIVIPWREKKKNQYIQS